MHNNSKILQLDCYARMQTMNCRHISYPLLSLFFFLLSTNSYSGGSDNRFLAGTGSAEINTKLGDPIGAWGGKANWLIPGDKAKANALSLSDGISNITIVSVDTLYLDRVDFNVINQEIKEKGINTNLILTATHGHANLLLEAPGARNIIRNAIINSVTIAHENLAPAMYSNGAGFFLGSYNRVIRKNGSSRTKPSHHICQEPLKAWVEGHPSDPIDNEVGIVHIVSKENSNTIATLINYASHPVIFGGKDNRVATPDYPGLVRRIVERNLGGKSLFLQGSAGDIVPRCGGLTSQTGHIEWETFSNGLSAAVISAVQNMSTYSEDISLKYITDTVEYIVPPEAKDWCGPTGSTQNVFLTTAKMNNDLMIAAISGEPFVKIGLNIKGKMSELNTSILVLGYTNGSGGYIPLNSDYLTGGYGTIPALNTCVQKNTSLKIVSALYKMLHSMHSK